MQRAAIYVRTSTPDQNPGMQLAELRLFAERRGWQIASEYLDLGVSGAKEKRPELNRLMADAARRTIDVIAVWRFDRFARSLKHLVSALADFNALGVDFVSLTEGMDTSTPSGKVLFAVVGAMAEFEHDLISERVKAGLRHAVAKGTKLGRPRNCVDGEKAATLHASGKSWRKIARQMGCSARTARRASVVFDTENEAVIQSESHTCAECPVEVGA